jgi:hypothetical protein
MQAVGATASADWLLDASLPALYDLLECLRPLGPFWNLTRPNRHGNPPSRESTSSEGAKNFVVVHKDTSKEEQQQQQQARPAKSTAAMRRDAVASS